MRKRVLKFACSLKAIKLKLLMCRSIQRQLRRKLVRLPAISPAPDQAQPNLEFRKVLAAAQKLKKESGDAYLGVDTLLRALVETSKDMQEALNEAGTCCI